MKSYPGSIVLNLPSNRETLIKPRFPIAVAEALHHLQPLRRGAEAPLCRVAKAADYSNRNLSGQQSTITPATGYSAMYPYFPAVTGGFVNIHLAPYDFTARPN
jgi:hypothetical protein